VRRLRRVWVAAVASILCVVTGSRIASACDGTTQHIVGYSWQRLKYVVEERSPATAEPSRFVTRRISTDEVLDSVTCAGSGTCTMSDALGMRACSFRPVPAKAPGELSLEAAGDSIGEVRLAGKDGPVTLLRILGAGTLGLRSGARRGANIVVFLTDTHDQDGCPRTVERAGVVADPEAPLRDREASVEMSTDGVPPELDLTEAPGVDIDVRVAHRATLARMRALMAAARTAAAAHLDALAGCWAQQVLSMVTSLRHHRHRRKLLVPSIRVEDVRVIVVRSPASQRYPRTSAVRLERP
jgi:hypothetical protein